MCLAETLSMTGFAAYPAFLALLRDTWGLSNSEAGFIGGAYFAGYMTAVPFLSSLTDRIDARRIYIGSCLLAAFSNLGFAILAQGVLPAALFQAMAGAGLAGTYMPGLKALTDRVAGPGQSRYISFYTATFAIGSSVSLLLAGWLGSLMDWRSVFGLLSFGPLNAALLFAFGLKPLPPPAAKAEFKVIRHIGIVLRERSLLFFFFGYTVHCWELLGLRAWMVAFLLFAYELQQPAQPPFSATTAAAAIGLLGLASSICGNEMAGRFGRHKYITAVMAISGAMAWATGLSVTWPCWLMLLMLALYFMTIMADSAALTAGLMAVAPLNQRGAAMAVYSLLGFGAGFIAPLVFGVVLDLAGGTSDSNAWSVAVGSLGLGCLIASVPAYFKHRHRPGLTS